ncbi:MAG: histidine phosphatase family protein [Oscillospiraceae bacterium]|nr:histidine phosphatase family protein [Oscillospiraceae bacterium]
MKILFTRHGETEWNSKNIICGRTDIELSEKGHEQARELAERIKKNHGDIDLIICSPMKRARQTASYTAKALGIEPIYDARLREWDYGEYEGKHRDAEGFLNAKLEFGCRMPNGGESVFDVVNRAYGLIDELYEKYPDKTILLVCHGGVCRVIETYFRNMTRDEFAHFFMGNCELREGER